MTIPDCVSKITVSPTRRKPAKNYRSGQVVVEYVLILTLVVTLLATAKMKIKADGALDLSGADSTSKTIMEHMSQSFSVWMQDILIIISLPT